MALRKIIEIEGTSTIQTSMGNFENGVQKISFLAYVKVMSIFGNKNQINATVNFKSDMQQFDKQYQIPVSVDTDSGNFIAQAYAHLKTLPEFAGAENC